MHLESPPSRPAGRAQFSPRLPTGQVLRTHLITEDRILGGSAGCGHNQLVKPPEHCFSVSRQEKEGW